METHTGCRVYDDAAHLPVYSWVLSGPEWLAVSLAAVPDLPSQPWPSNPPPAAPSSPQVIEAAEHLPLFISSSGAFTKKNADREGAGFDVSRGRKSLG